MALSPVAKSLVANPAHEEVIFGSRGVFTLLYHSNPVTGDFALPAYLFLLLLTTHTQAHTFFN